MSPDMPIDNASHVTGLDLKLQRTAAGVTQVALARRMGRSRQSVSIIERSYRPRPAAVERYVRALGEVGR